MADPDKAFLQKRVGVGAMLASVATLLIFFAWRFAAIFDANLGLSGWLWLVFETAFVFGAFPIIAILYCLIGVFLVHRSEQSKPMKRLHSALLCGLVGLMAGFILTGMGLFDEVPGGVLNTAPVGFAVMVFSSICGGYVGHAGWFPPASITE
ncbi:MAG: hypothetical protein AAFN48_11925 [Pseudomonadota bacterium]